MPLLVVLKVMKITAFLILVLFGFGLVTAQAQERKDFDSVTLSEAGIIAYKKLLIAGVFSIGGVGYGGEISESEEAMEVLLSEQNAIAAFKSLVTNATAEGGLYGLAGLYVKDLQLFKDESAVYKKRDLPADRKVTPPYGEMIEISEGFVVVQSGCIVGSESATKIIAAIETGKFGWNLKRYAEKK